MSVTDRSETNRRAITGSILLAALSLATAALAQTQPTTGTTTQASRGDFRTLTVSPMATPVPALKYPLRVPYVDQIDGNAAPLYLQAFSQIASDPTLNALDDAALDLADDAAFLRWIDEHHPMLTTEIPPLLVTATLRGQCDWALPVRFENVRAALPFLNQARATMRLLHAKVRLALARDDVEQAIRLLRVATVLADQVDAGNVFVVNGLVSGGIEMFNIDQIHLRLVQRPDAPNLYWSLRQLPVPFCNLRGSMEAEQASTLAAIPILRKARDGTEITADDWRAYLQELDGFQQAFAAGWSDAPPLSDMRNTLAAGLAAMAVNVPARRHYARTRKLSDEQVVKLDPLMLAATYTFETYKDAVDDAYKWFSLPYPQMLPGLRRSFNAIDRSNMRTNLFAITAPSLSRIAVTYARIDRTIAAVTCVEAIRAYAAAHDGALPPTLDAIVDTPAPVNPVTGKPFEYAVSGDVATLSDDGALVEWPMRYEIRLRK